MYRYAPDILEALGGHGLSPGPLTPPALVRDALSDLYRYEIRVLRGRFLRREISKPDYAPRVIALRRKYWLLSLPTAHWARLDDGPRSA